MAAVFGTVGAILLLMLLLVITKWKRRPRKDQPLTTDEIEGEDKNGNKAVNVDYYDCGSDLYR